MARFLEQLQIRGTLPRTPGALRDSSELDGQSLRAAGLRVTAPRLAVLAVVREGDHLAVDDIGDLSRKRIGSISLQAV